MDGFSIYQRLCRREGLEVIEGEREGGLLLVVGAGLLLATADAIRMPWKAAVDLSGGKSAAAWRVAYGAGAALRPQWVALVGWLSITRAEEVEKGVATATPYAPTVSYFQPELSLPAGVEVVSDLESLRWALQRQLKAWTPGMAEAVSDWDSE